MNVEKAVEIVESLGVVDVVYNGDPVWIENVIKESQKAKVRYLKTKEELMVNLSELQEV